MSGSALDQAPFLPASAPRRDIIDLSGTLSGGQQGTLEQQAHAFSNLNVKVVVLPKDFSTNDLDALGVALAKRWHVSADRMLVMIDIKDHKVRMYPGDKLQAQGLTNGVLSQDIIPHYFIPAMKQGNLEEAIRATLNASQARTAHVAVKTPQATREQQSISSNIPPYAGEQHAGVSLWLWVGVLAALGAAVFMAAANSRKKDNIKLAEAFKERVAPLYEKADQIGAASEYLKTEEHPEMAQRVAQFFNKLTTLEKAVSEVASMEKHNQVWQVRDGYLKLMRLVALLEPEADALKTDVNALTGGVETVPELPRNAQLEPMAARADDQQKVTIPDRFRDDMQYRRPEWTYQPAYSAPPVGSGMSSLMMLGMMINQMEMNRRMDQMNWNMHQGGMFGNFDQNQNQNWNNDQGSWNNDQGGGGFDAGWGDTGDSGSFGDAGGDWGGGGDFGGGDW
jgi:uncharacterized membrane protein YgcG